MQEDQIVGDWSSGLDKLPDASGDEVRTIIAGSRHARDFDVFKAMEVCPFSDEISVVISGTARGADQYGESWAEQNNLPIELFPADWKSFGKSAGFIRNKKMAQNADALVAVWDGVSHGTKNMIDTARKMRLRVFVYYYRTNSWISECISVDAPSIHT